MEESQEQKRLLYLPAGENNTEVNYAVQSRYVYIYMPNYTPLRNMH